MTIFSMPHRIERAVLPRLERLPFISAYAKTRGWPFVLAWIHRITGITMFLYVLLHIYTLTLLQNPQAFDAAMGTYRIFLFVVLEWALAIPVVLHAFNGGRLILYEVFGSRANETLLRWVWALSLVYVLLLGLLMIMGNQSVSSGFFWLTALLIALILAYGVASGIRTSGASLWWKLQRVSGSFLLVLIPAHMLFMHLNTGVGHEAASVVARLQNPFMKLVDIALVAAVLFHSGYGLLSIIKDYVASRAVQKISAVLIVAVLGSLAWIGIRLTIRL